MSNVIELLDRLADYQAKRELIEMDKRALLDDVKVPAEVEAIVRAGMNQVASVERGYYAKFDEINREVAAQLEKITIPEEIKIALAAIDRERALVQAYKVAKEDRYRKEIAAKKLELQEMYQAQTRDIYAALENRKRDIESEFAEKRGAVDENIAKLEADIKEAAKLEGKTVNGKFYQAVYVKGRVSWNTDMLNGMIALVPQLEKARKVGEPSITLRRI